MDHARLSKALTLAVFVADEAISRAEEVPSDAHLKAADHALARLRRLWALAKPEPTTVVTEAPKAAPVVDDITRAKALRLLNKRGFVSSR